MSYINWKIRSSPANSGLPSGEQGQIFPCMTTEVG